MTYLEKTNKIIAFLAETPTSKLWNFCPDYQKRDWLENYNEDTNVNKNYHESVTIMPYICFTGAYYIALLFATPVGEWSTLKYGKYNIPTQAAKLTRDLPNGVYFVDIGNKKEGHAFVAVLHDNNITIFNTYGGVEQIFITNFNKNQWFDIYDNLANLPIELLRDFYIHLWGFTKDKVGNIAPYFENNSDVKITDSKIARLM
jgi:hypothetical protein